MHGKKWARNLAGRNKITRPSNAGGSFFLPPPPPPGLLEQNQTIFSAPTFACLYGILSLFVILIIFPVYLHASEAFEIPVPRLHFSFSFRFEDLLSPFHWAMVGVYTRYFSFA